MRDLDPVLPVDPRIRRRGAAANRRAGAGRLGLLSLALPALLLCLTGRLDAQPPGGPPDFARPATWRALENALFAEINLLRADPAGYADRVVLPLKDRLERVPADPGQRFLGVKTFLAGGEKIDYVLIEEGGSHDAAVAVIDEAVAALRQAKPPGMLRRNAPLDAAARYFSRDFLGGGKSRRPHVDSLGRGPAARWPAFGATEEALQKWSAFRQRADGQETVAVDVFLQEQRWYWFELVGARGYRYWSVPRSFGEFVQRHGDELTLPRLKKPGYRCQLALDAARRRLRHGERTVAFPWPLPIYGENVVWGHWSWRHAPRGLVCWWVLDPGIANRGHRRLLLDADFKFCGIGCAWSRDTGWVATLDAASEALQPLE